MTQQDRHDETAAPSGVRVPITVRAVDDTDTSRHDATEQPAKRRSGLGRGLSDLLPVEEPGALPTHLQPESGQRTAVSRVVVAESSEVVVVEMEDSAGARVSVPVVDGDVDRAIVDAAVALAGAGSAVSVRTRDIETDDGLLVLATATRGRARAASAAFVEYGRPFAVARAVFEAVQDLTLLA